MIVEALAGAAAGILARYTLPDSPGILSDMLFGLIGGGVGAFIYKLFGHRLSFDQYDLWSIASAVFGAFIVIAVTRMTAGRRTVY